MAEYAHTAVARKWHWCDDERGRWGTQGRHRIAVGAQYVRCVAFPDGDVNSSDRPWVAYICADCYCQYGATMPPPRKSRRRNP